MTSLAIGRESYFVVILAHGMCHAFGKRINDCILSKLTLSITIGAYAVPSKDGHAKKVLALVSFG